MSRSIVHSIVRPAMLCAAALGAACVGGDDVPAGAPAQPLNGIAVFNFNSGCSAAEQATIVAAMDLLDQQVNRTPEPLRACLRDAIFSPDDGEHVGTIMDLIQQNMPTSFTCQTAATTSCGGSFTWLACASVGIPNEDVRIDHTYLANGTVAQIAASILHEIGHNKGFRHLSGTEDPYAVTDQLNTCSRVVSGTPAFNQVTVPTAPTGGGRSSWRGESEQQQVGGGAGDPFLGRYCGPDDLVVGQTVGLSAGLLGARVGRLDLRCRNRFTNAITVLATVGAGGAPTTDDCPAGEVVVGVTGHADKTIYRMGLLCAPRAQVIAGNNAVTTTLPERGTAVGPRFIRSCPTGMAMSAMHGRVGSSLEQMRVVCRDLGRTPPPSPSSLATLGAVSGTSPSRAREFCSDLGLMTGLYGRIGASVLSPSLHRLGGLCMGTERVGGALQLRAGAVQHITSGVGGEGGNALSGGCPAGMALVGVRAWEGIYGERSDVDARCASISAWDGAGAAPITTVTPFANNAFHVASQIADCPRGSFVVGFETGSSLLGVSGVRVVDRITPVCRDL
ncbi:MAG: hypothetical protein U0324_46800 [Polyangiales bacterium]